MCKKPVFLANNSHTVNIPLLKPYSAFEAKHYIKKIASKIKQTLDAFELDDILNDENLNPETDTDLSASKHDRL